MGPLTRTQPLQQPILQLWISACTLSSFGVLWKEWAPFQSPLKILSVTTHPCWILMVPAACIDPPSVCVCRDHLSPSFNKPCEQHPGLGHVTVPCPPVLLKHPQNKWALDGRKAAPPSTPRPSIARSTEHAAQGTNKLFSNFWLLMTQSEPNEPSG